ncbi:MAG: 30S ribosomal protein S6, partial [Minisyncoccales bacterium]
DEISTFITKMKEELQKNGKTEGVALPERKKLAYPVLNQIEAWFYFFNLKPEAGDRKELLNSVEKILKENKDILRFLIIKKDTKKTEAPIKPMRTRPIKVEEIKEVKEEPTIGEKPKKSKVQLEEIGEKLDEMLGEK